MIGYHNIEEFEPAPRKDPKSYPGKRPETSYLFSSDDGVIPIKMIDGKKLEDSVINDNTLDDELHNRKTIPIKDRYLIVGYGSNVNPAQLKYKFNGINNVFPVLKGKMNNFDIVYANSFTKYGYVPATITSSPGTTVDVWANLLDENQLELMDKTEGRDKKYWLAKLDGELILENGEHISPVYSYVSTRGVMTINENPLRLTGIAASHKKFEGFNQTEILTILQKKIKPTYTIDEFIKYVTKNYDELIVSSNSCFMKFDRIVLPENPMKIHEMFKAFM